MMHYREVYGSSGSHRNVCGSKDELWSPNFEFVTCVECHKVLEARDKEQDPSGKSPHQPGAKLDAGKPLAGEVLSGFAAALEAVIEVGTHGARKYTLGGWRSVDDAERRYTSAMLRHWLAEHHETRDAKSGLTHAAHVAWNALARLHFVLERLRIHGGCQDAFAEEMPRRSRQESLQHSAKLEAKVKDLEGKMGQIRVALRGCAFVRDYYRVRGDSDAGYLARALDQIERLLPHEGPVPVDKGANSKAYTQEPQL